jgi:Protein of unknown function (DUF3024)
MPIPISQKEHVSRLLARFCVKYSPAHLSDQVKVDHRFRGNTVEIVEHRPGFADPTKWTEMVIATFRYSVKNGTWQLYWADRNSKWHVYELVKPSRDIGPLLREVETDPTCIFWG